MNAADINLRIKHLRMQPSTESQAILNKSQASSNAVYNFPLVRARNVCHRHDDGRNSDQYAKRHDIQRRRFCTSLPASSQFCKRLSCTLYPLNFSPVLQCSQRFLLIGLNLVLPHSFPFPENRSSSVLVGPYPPATATSLPFCCFKKHSSFSTHS